MAFLDYINHLKGGQSLTPFFPSISGNNSRQMALAAQNRVIPERRLKNVGIDGGKKRVDYMRGRIHVLLVVQAHLVELMR